MKTHYVRKEVCKVVDRSYPVLLRLIAYSGFPKPVIHNKGKQHTSYWNAREVHRWLNFNKVPSRYPSAERAKWTRIEMQNVQER